MHFEQIDSSSDTFRHTAQRPCPSGSDAGLADAHPMSRSSCRPGTARQARGRARLFAAFLAAALTLFLGQAHPALAHRVNVFAWVEGGAIRCESSFSSGNPARDVKVTATLAGSGTVMGTAVTDAKGRCTLPITPELRAAKADLVIEVQAGEGHRNIWTMPAEEYLAAPAAAVPAAATGAAEAAGSAATVAAQDAPKAAAPLSATTQPAGTAASTGVAIDEAALRRIVAEAVAEQVGPLRHSLAAMQSGGPRMADVAGGIGYIVGLAGIALWARSRRR
ncbi:MAG TPA: hypothetical protein VE028_02925 [Nitratidesulfovibrio sp.]|nr:hypothetical protein [Nitratidesulfovibrio sp.]